MARQHHTFNHHHHSKIIPSEKEKKKKPYCCCVCVCVKCMCMPRFFFFSFFLSLFFTCLAHFKISFQLVPFPTFIFLNVYHFLRGRLGSISFVLGPTTFPFPFSILSFVSCKVTHFSGTLSPSPAEEGAISTHI